MGHLLSLQYQGTIKVSFIHTLINCCYGISSSEVAWISGVYDLGECSAWVEHAKLVQAKVN